MSKKVKDLNKEISKLLHTIEELERKLSAIRIRKWQEETFGQVDAADLKKESEGLLSSQLKKINKEVERLRRQVSIEEDLEKENKLQQQLANIVNFITEVLRKTTTHQYKLTEEPYFWDNIEVHLETEDKKLIIVVVPTDCTFNSTNALQVAPMWISLYDKYLSKVVEDPCLVHEDEIVVSKALPKTRLKKLKTYIDWVYL